MLTRVTGARLVLVSHAMPDVQPNVPAREWHLGDDGQVHRALAAAYLGGAAHAGWEPHSPVVRRLHAAVLRHLAIASTSSGAVVVGTHGIAMTIRLFARVRAGGDRVGFWATLEFPDVVFVDLELRNYQRSL
jgi:hypothetical protein